MNNSGEGFLSNLIIGLVIFSFVISGLGLFILGLYPNYSVDTGANNSYNETDILNEFVDGVDEDSRSIIYNMTNAHEESQAVVEDAPRDPITAVWAAIKRAGSALTTGANLIRIASAYLGFMPPIFWGFVITLLVTLFTLAIIEFWWRRKG